MKPNILFLIIDGLRADKCYGISKTSITPTIDYIIKNGTYFEQAISAAPHTVPALASIFTGLFPFECLLQDTKIFILNTSTVSYIKNLIDYGYKSYALVPELISKIGISNVFEHVESYPYYLKTYNGIGQKIIDKLEIISAVEPWIYYLHLYDLQWLTEWNKNKSLINEGPQQVRETKFGINQYERMLSAMDIWIGKILQKIDLSKTLIILTSDHGHEAASYDSVMDEYMKFIQSRKLSEPGIIYKISHKIVKKFPNSLYPLRKKLSRIYTDIKIEKIKARIQPEITKLELQNLRLSDKRLKKQSIDYTAQAYDERFRIPLIFCGYGISSRIIAQQVRSVDIFPTIGEIINLPIKNKKQRGISLLPLIQGRQIEELPAFIESAVNSPLSSTTNVIGVRTSHYKYFRSRNNSNDNIHLFDLKTDPYEENNIAVNNSDIVKKMENILVELKSDKNFCYVTTNEKTKEAELKEVEEELKKLGYL